MTVTAATLNGSEANLDDESLEGLRMMTRGDVLTRDDAGRDAVRAPYNAMYPGNPTLVVRPTGTADVIDAVKFAREKGWWSRCEAVGTRWRDSRASRAACSSTSR